MIQLLIVTNLLLWSNDTSNAAWSKRDGSACQRLALSDGPHLFSGYTRSGAQLRIETRWWTWGTERREVAMPGSAWMRVFVELPVSGRGESVEACVSGEAWGLQFETRPPDRQPATMVETRHAMMTLKTYYRSGVKP